MTDPELDAQVKEVRGLLDTRLGVRGRDLGQQIRRAGRRLPSRARVAGQTLVEAERLAGHPRLSRQSDPAARDTAHRVLVDHLSAIDPADRRKGRILGILGVISFNLLLFAALVLTFLVWRGVV